MTESDLLTLMSPDWPKWLEEHLHMPPTEIALNASHPEIPPSLLATQVKYLQKAAKKLPNYYHHRCIIPPRAFEQASSEVTAQMKPFKGKTCLDLTGGLGVDSFYFSKSFQTVTAIESNTVLVNIARHNLSKLQVENVTFVNTDAQSFLNRLDTPNFDLIYLDPDRRSVQGQRLIRLQDCEPQILKLLPFIFQHTQKCVLKVSPLFDVDEAFRLFDQVVRLYVLSVDNECKELLIELQSNPIPESEIHIYTHQKNDTQTFIFLNDQSVSEVLPSSIPETYTYLYEPDVAFYKARCTQELFAKYFQTCQGTMNHSEGYFFSDHPIETGFPGRVFRIKEKMSYQPRKLKKWLKAQHIDQIHLTKRYFPFSIRQIQQQLSVIPGGTQYLIFTMDGLSHKHAFWAERIDL